MLPDHVRTVYRYSDVVTSSYGRGFLTPRDSVRQRCLSHELVIEPGAADSSTSRDAYGNLSSYFHVTERNQTLTITSNSVVEVDPVPPSCTAAGRRLRLGDRPAGRARRCLRRSSSWTYNPGDHRRGAPTPHRVSCRAAR